MNGDINDDGRGGTNNKLQTNHEVAWVAFNVTFVRFPILHLRQSVRPKAVFF
jgi:hypothetical protein